jgi:methyl-accepting chemotaxis protein WspA
MGVTPGEIRCPAWPRRAGLRVRRKPDEGQPAWGTSGMKKRTIHQRILFSFAVVLLLVIVMGVISLMRLANVEKAANTMLAESLPGLYNRTQLLATWEENYALTASYIFHDDRNARLEDEKQLAASWAQIEQLNKQYEPMIDTAIEKQLTDSLNAVLVPYKRVQGEILKLADGRSDKEAQAKLLAELDPQFNEGEKVIRKLEDVNKASAEDSTQQIVAAVSSARTGIVISMLAALFVALVSGILLLRSVTVPLRELSSELGRSGVQVDASVKDIASTAKHQQATASEIAATTTEIGSTSHEISATSKVLVRTMNEVSSMAEQSAALAGTGQAGLSHMEETMRQVMEAAGLVNAKLGVLNDKAANISQVVTTITRVADQTNLLSLNAAIEAEKAGDYGRGFSVVALEIRRLADQTAVATLDIEQMVKEIQSAVSAGVMGMDKFSEQVRRGTQEMQQVGAQLSQIIQQVQAVAPRIESVNEGMQAQATGADQISNALSQLSEATRDTVESLRQSGRAIDGLNEVVATLSGSVSHLNLLI